jgi:hypothetical protein
MRKSERHLTPQELAIYETAVVTGGHCDTATVRESL